MLLMLARSLCTPGVRDSAKWRRTPLQERIRAVPTNPAWSDITYGASRRLCTMAKATPVAGRDQPNGPPSPTCPNSVRRRTPRAIVADPWNFTRRRRQESVERQGRV